jgi:hypothetical protein
VTHELCVFELIHFQPMRKDNAFKTFQSDAA